MKIKKVRYSIGYLLLFIGAFSLSGLSQDSSNLMETQPIQTNTNISNDKILLQNIQVVNEQPIINLRNHKASFFRKVARGEKYIGGLELISMGILVMAPKKWTKWDEDWMQEANRNIKKAWTRAPIEDKDDWDVNYIGHAVAGSYYYNTVRSQNATPFQSLAFSAFQSALWEYVIEGIAERPSIQDLIYTPISGIVLGEITHILTLQMRKNGFNLAEKAFVIVFNPMYAINNGLRTKKVKFKNNVALY